MLCGFSGAVLVIQLAIYLIDPYNLRQYPGPILPKFSYIWLGWISQRGARSEVVHRMHQKYGPFLRISPTEISIADPEALSVVYAHGSGTTKSSFYDAFVSIERGLMNSRDRQQHARKRKIVSHIFSPKSVLEFEPHIRRYVGMLIAQWDRLYDAALKGGSGDEGEGGWIGHSGRLWLDCLPWCNYLAFDIIGDLAFGAPFGMISAAKDVAPVPAAPKALSDVSFSKPEVKYVPAVAVLNGRGEYSMATGVLPGWWRPIVSLLPWYRAGQQNVRELAGISIVAVSKRLETPTDSVDILSKLLLSTDENGDLMGRSELTAEAQTFLIAGSDTTSNSACAIIDYIAGNPRVQARLQDELDANLGTEDDFVTCSEQIKHLPYLEACINEGLRIHSTSALGLPRVVPEGGLTVCGQDFPAGTVLSVPSYTIHRDPGVWGDDPEVYRPERWLEADRAAAIQKTFNPYSVGPRACIGRNLAALELLIIVSSLVRRFDFVLAEPEEPLATREGFLRKPLRCNVGIKRRDVCEF
ncbi:cytochrome P450 monooxygenase [Mycena capillaripes]|nr:cytochrome P450 monooxygenase [Mycena capillaripes]